MLVRYLSGWFLLMLIAIVNGAVREATYGRSVTDLAAHQISTATGILSIGAAAWLLGRIWPIRYASQAFAIGGLWLAMTVAFEFGFGRYVAGHSWTRLLADYNLLEGRVWPVFLLWIAVVPYLCHRLSGLERAGR